MNKYINIHIYNINNWGKLSVLISIKLSLKEQTLKKLNDHSNYQDCLPNFTDI